MSENKFHFTLGPVQAFVAQARRTRDLWAGSFLLSWLSAHAMAEVRRQGGRIEFPVVTDYAGMLTDPLIAAVERQPLQVDPAPRIGSLPNRFAACVQDGFDPQAVTRAVLAVWCKLAEAVWKCFVGPVADRGRDTRAIWERQVQSFWEIAWVLGPDPGDHSDASWLEARKNWRAHWLADEPGDHCALMGQRQELSGYIRAHDNEKASQDNFWEALRNQIGDLELRDHEHLCAIALIKRLFPKLSKSALEETIGFVPGGKPKAVSNWPSTAYMAVVPWLRGCVSDAKRVEALCAYERVVIHAAGEAVRGERSANIASLAALNELAWLDGNFFLPGALGNADDTPLQDETARTEMVHCLRALQEGYPAQPYYALLLLDGDSLGKHLCESDPGAISRKLSVFTGTVADVVHEHDGVTIYAGGDDVMALLPYDRALDCSQALRKAYGEALGASDFTASAAIVLAHYHQPLREVLIEAHRQLDEVAKDGNGRDSLAIVWFKATGRTAEWVSTWCDGEGTSVIERLKKLVGVTAENAFSAGFFYKLETRYPMLAERKHEANLEADLLGIERMLVAEYLKTRECQPTLAEAESAIHTLYSAAQRWLRDASGTTVTKPGLQLEALRLARLLAGKEVRA